MPKTSRQLSDDTSTECCGAYKDHVFVFGSNLAGIHGAGAARHALLHHGAIMNHGEGRIGMSYALPTKGWEVEKMTLDGIKVGVGLFLDYARRHPDVKFYVTPVGCGLAGWTAADIAPLFKYAPDNCRLPEGWRS